MTELMVDLETLGTRSDAPIISIGACIFNDFKIVDSFYRVVDIESYTIDIFHTDPLTIKWWFARHEMAKELIEYENRVHIEIALADFVNFFLHPVHKPDKIWAHGATFDIPILEHWFRMFRKPIPWDFRAVRDTRTVYDWADVKPDHTVYGDKHNALVDAKSQAAAVIKARSKLCYPQGL